MNSSINNVNFKGYDAIKLKGFYMQGFVEKKDIDICRQMKKIAEKENLDFFINQNNTGIKKVIAEGLPPAKPLLPVWGQDRKAFLKNGYEEFILCNKQDGLKDLPEEFSSYNIKKREILPRGGNYYIGYKPNGEKWMIINGKYVTEYGEKRNKQEKISLENIETVYGVKRANIYNTGYLGYDLDMSVRPIGYPYVLVNNEAETLKNIEKMRKKFPQSDEIYEKLKWFQKYLNPDYLRIKECDELYNCLKDFGFKPIKIGGFYSEDINFLNSIAFKNENNKISIISNSTKYSCPELEYLEELFEQDLREKVEGIENVYFVSGGKKTEETFGEYDWIKTHNFPQYRFNEYHNVIMDFLGERHGGIHCMTAEIPDFSKLDYVV